MRTVRNTVTIGLTLCLLGGCVIRQLPSDGSELLYTYSHLDFSGKVWQRAQAACQREGKKVMHLHSDCTGWFRCVSRFRCE